MTSIEWTDVVWNCVVGCSRVSAGCEHCYAERVAHRGMSAQHRGLTVLGKRGPRWTGEVRFLADRLAEPLRWRQPRRVFVNSMSDLFHEDVTNEQIAAVFAVMAAAPHHTFQVLTKRPERARAFFAWVGERERTGRSMFPDDSESWRIGQLLAVTLRRLAGVDGARGFFDPRRQPWPLPNVWLGVSVEDQRTADERIPLLLETPAALRWVSYEPALGPVNFRRVGIGDLSQDVLRFGAPMENGWIRGLDWIVVGGESGPGARPFDLAWARSVVEQGREAGTAVFVKQFGARPHDSTRRSVVDRFGVAAPWLSPERADELAPQYHDGRVEPAWLRLRDRKGGDPSEWPADLRVRQWPAEVRDAAE